jgi:hypothetical protein
MQVLFLLERNAISLLKNMCYGLNVPWNYIKTLVTENKWSKIHSVLCMQL